MLAAPTPKSSKITEITQKKNAVFLKSERGTLRILPVTDGAVRITYTERESFANEEKAGIVKGSGDALVPQPVVSKDEGTIRVCCQKMRLEISEKTGAITYFSENGGLLFREQQEEARELEEFTNYVPVQEEAAEIEKIQTADGEKEVVRTATKVPSGSLYHTKLNFLFCPEEAIYGLGQQDDGAFDLRHRTVYLHQANRKIAIPMFVSTKGYGLLMDTYSPMIFSETEQGAHIYTEADKEQDYYFLYGGSPEGVVAQYRQLTGKAALLPRWAFGYWQSQERYETQEEILAVAEEYRRRGIGLDAVVLDWLSWGDNLWGQKTMDPARFPDPAGMIKKLEEMGVQFLISIWPNMTEESENYQEMKEAGGLLFGSSVYNAFSEEARKIYWKQIREGLFCHGIRAWWCDSSEPFTPEWSHKMKPEPGVAFAQYCRETADHMPVELSNAFGLYHARTLYEGQRGELAAHPEYPDRRMCNLTRSAYTGQQRYGTVLWSGDTAACWETLRQQIAASLNFAASGLPYWTTDIGAFFVKNGGFWYWRGQYDNTTKDPAYCELYTRWFQWAAFLPVFRAHGTDCRRELWQFEETDSGVYEALVNTNVLRYRFLPYLYSLAGTCFLEDQMILKPLAFAFPKQEGVWEICDQYLLGDSLLVCPVTEPMEYGRQVYLPEGSGWFEYDSDTFYEGGQWIYVDAPLNKIPLFVRAGSILPMGRKTECAGERNEIAEFVVYGGADASFVLYEDAGDGYGYEKGEYRTVRLFCADGETEVSCEVLHDGMPAGTVTKLSGVPVRVVRGV